MKLNERETVLLARLRKGSDGPSGTRADGSEWAYIYLANVSGYYKNRHEFAGLLAALEAKGLYEKTGEKEYDGIGGYVKW